MEEVEKYRDLCDGIFAADSRVRYTVVLDETGRIVAGGMRPGVKSIEPLEHERRVDFQVTILAGVIKTSSKVFGPASFVFFKHEKINLIVFPIANKQLDVSTQPDFPLEDVPKILTIVDRWKQTR